MRELYSHASILGASFPIPDSLFPTVHKFDMSCPFAVRRISVRIPAVNAHGRLYLSHDVPFSAGDTSYKRMAQVSTLGRSELCGAHQHPPSLPLDTLRDKST